jgi:DNA polymerase (family X)
VAGYQAEIAGLNEKGLGAIPNVGGHLAHKIAEFRDTGSVAELDELHARVPAGLRTLLTVPGLRTLRGWGQRSEENLAQAIQDAQSGGGRIHLDVAMDLAEQLLGELTALPSVLRAAYAGSLRRMRETIGDIDLLVTSRHPAEVMAAFCSSPRVTRVLAHGPARASVLTTKGVQVDVRVVDPAVWGAALMYFTGSKPHNVRIRTMAARAGLKLSEYGLFDAKSGQQLAAATEEDVYARLGLCWIPPILREDCGEIEAAVTGRLPHLVQECDIRGDLHVHTNLTDGVATLQQMVAAARGRGYAYCAITDHAPQLYMERMTTDKMLAQRQQLRGLERSAGMALLHGTELNIAPDGDPGLGRRLPGRLRHRGRLGAHPVATGQGPVRRAMHAGVRFAISTDAHAVPHLDYLKFGVATAQRGWAGKADVINTYPLEKLQRFLAGKARPRPQTSLARRC